MTSPAKFRKDKEIVAEYETQVKAISIITIWSAAAFLLLLLLYRVSLAHTLVHCARLSQVLRQAGSSSTYLRPDIHLTVLLPLVPAERAAFIFLWLEAHAPEPSPETDTKLKPTTISSLAFSDGAMQGLREGHGGGQGPGRMRRGEGRVRPTTGLQMALSGECKLGAGVREEAPRKRSLSSAFGKYERAVSVAVGSAYMDSRVIGFLHTQRKEQSVLSAVNCWNLLLSQVKRESRDHATLSDLYLNNIIPRFAQVSEDSGRLFKKVMKKYHMDNTDSMNAESKLKDAEKQEEKQMGRSGRQDDRQTPRSPDALASIKTEDKHVRRSSVKKIEKMKEKRQAKYTENKLKAVKARNEYLLALEATNSCVFKYYIHDLSDIINCCDLGYHASLHRALRTYLSAELNVEASKHSGLEGLEGAAESLEPNGDKQKLMETYNNVFCPPVRFDFQSHMGDTVKKTMEATMSTIQDMVTVEDYDVSECFHHSNSMESVKSTVSESYLSKPSLAKRRANQQETEQFYFTARRATVALP
ncbi:hypothetical protein CRUP_014127, partial [Coryphaenoides rupestris]